MPSTREERDFVVYGAFCAVHVCTLECRLCWTSSILIEPRPRYSSSVNSTLLSESKRAVEHRTRDLRDPNAAGRKSHALVWLEKTRPQGFFFADDDISPTCLEKVLYKYVASWVRGCVQVNGCLF